MNSEVLLDGCGLFQGTDPVAVVDARTGHDVKTVNIDSQTYGLALDWQATSRQFLVVYSTGSIHAQLLIW